MALSKDQAIEIVNGFLKDIRQKHDVRAAYLFGSFAKNTPKEYSDIDVALVLGSIRFPAPPPFDESFEIFHEAQRFNSLLEVVSFRQEEFEENGGSLVKRIKKEGIRLF